jgi:hypothetical protein
MASLKAIRLALARQIQDNVYPPIQAVANPGGTINTPCALVIPAHGTFARYGQTLGQSPVLGMPAPVVSATDFNLDVMVVVTHADFDRMQEDLDRWMGYEETPGVTVSIATAVMMDETLGGAVEWCVPESADSYAPVTWGGIDYFGARIHFSLGLSGRLT